ncbi:thiamine diphosphokinase [bacterium D16-54]|nr:thiamine diphosphokinase [bacterium D16-54]RKJ13494.1 thiamine diphosphokinase [bacterium D16-56]
MRVCLIITGGKLDLAFARSFLERETFHKVIAVDGGLEAVRALGLTPDYVVGDFDTVEEDVIEEFRKASYIVWESHKPEKNETDTELARNRALTLACDRIVFLGATGGRVDHLLGNLHLLYGCMEREVEAWIVDAWNKIYLVDQNRTFVRDQLWGKYVSFLPYTEKVTGITLKGFKYPLNKKNIKRGEEAGLCISNEVEDEVGTLEFEEGVLVCVESRD